MRHFSCLSGLICRLESFSRLEATGDEPPPLRPPNKLSESLLLSSGRLEWLRGQIICKELKNALMLTFAAPSAAQTLLLVQRCVFVFLPEGAQTFVTP